MVQTEVRSARSTEDAAESTTRSRILNAVLESGPVSASEIAARMGLTAAAVRRHLDALERDRFIEVTLVRRPGAGAGRPARRYVVAPEGHERLGNDYLEVAHDALRTLRELGGEEALRGFVQRHQHRIENRYRPAVEAAGEDVADRLDALVRQMAADGYAASSTMVQVGSQRRGMASLQLCQGHCPLLELAEDHPEFCEAETRMIGSLLGVDIRRLSTLASGAHVCNTHVPLERRDEDPPRSAERT